MKRCIFFAAMMCTAIALPKAAMSQEPPKKTIAIGDVDAGTEGGGRAWEVKETIQIGLKKELEKKGFAVTITSPAVAAAENEPEQPDPPELPADRAPTQKEMAAYTAAMQRWQRQMSGQVKAHKQVGADAYFEFRLARSESGADTGGAVSMIGGFAGIDTSLGDVGTKTSKVYLIATMRDPRTGAALDRYTAKASSVRMRSVAGFTSYDYGDDEITREKLFSSAVRDCANWIAGRVR